LENPRILSIGWGVQSFTLAMMAKFGDIAPFDYIIHGDTSHESTLTYAHIEKYKSIIIDPSRYIVVGTATSNKAVVRISAESKNKYTYVPVYVKNKAGKDGKLIRYCTSKWKIDPANSWIKKYAKTLGYFRKNTIPPDDFIHVCLGISLDEYTRMKQSRLSWIKNVYPLIDLRMTREDCVTYLTERGIDVPPKSSCVFCPFSSPEKFAELWNIPQDRENILAAEREILTLKPDREHYIHRSLQPIQAVVDQYNLSKIDPTVDDPGCDSGYCFV
jgi:hypothetical protein